MRTTVRLDEQLMQEAKSFAAKEGMTFTALIEDSLRQRMEKSKGRSQESRVALPVSKRSGGLHPWLDPEILCDNSRLADVMDELDGMDPDDPRRR